jgi:hypothetical protein
MLILTLGGTQAAETASRWAYLTVSNVSCDALASLYYDAKMNWKSSCGGDPFHDDEYGFYRPYI